MKKICLGLVCIMLITSLLNGCTSYKGKGAVDFIVDVPKGREPVVLQLTDTQIIDSAQKRTEGRLSDVEDAYWATDKINERCFDDIAETIENTNPDLILLTGDIVYGEFDDAGTSFLKIVDYMDSFKIPWAPVFGNHDNESEMGADWQCEQFEKAKYCLFKQRELTGNGNYTVGIRQGGEMKRVFFMLDSNGCSAISAASIQNCHTITTAGFWDDQIDWYTQAADEIKAEYPNVKLSFAFHIQLKVFDDAYSKYGFTNYDTTEHPINIDELEDKAEGDFGYLGSDLKSAWDWDYRVWNSIKSLGADSIFVGHEHCNSASVVYEGVRIQFGQKTGTYDRANFVKPDGTIYGAYCGTDKPLSGGTVMILSPEDGSITDAYIYLCK